MYKCLNCGFLQPYNGLIDSLGRFIRCGNCAATSDVIIGHDDGGFYTDSDYVSDEVAVAQGFEPSKM